MLQVPGGEEEAGQQLLGGAEEAGRDKPPGGVAGSRATGGAGGWSFPPARRRRRRGRAGVAERLSATWKARIERERTFSLFSFPRASFPAPDAISARALPRRPKISPVSGSSAYAPPCAPARRGIAAEAPICAA